MKKLCTVPSRIINGKDEDQEVKSCTVPSRIINGKDEDEEVVYSPL